MFDRVCGSMIGLALSDAFGACVEYRPRAFLKQHPVTDLQDGGTWGLNKGEVISVHTDYIIGDPVNGLLSLNYNHLLD